MTPLDIFHLLILWLAISSAAPYTGCNDSITSATECWITPETGGIVWITPQKWQKGE